MPKRKGNFVAMKISAGEGTLLKSRTVSFASTGKFSPLVTQYTAQHPILKPFINRFPTVEAFRSQIEEKAASYVHRQALVDALRRQYKAASLKQPAIDTLEKENTYTITTGHQLCLFTGPLYVIYKLASAVKTARRLAEAYPEHSFVPVFWMASEDHDLAEANHFHIGQTRIAWHTEQQGAVGRMRTAGLETIATRLKQELGTGYRAGALVKLFEDAYLKHSTMAAATRWLVHKLFGNFGVVVVDSDDSNLKALAVPLFRRDLFDATTMQQVLSTNEQLSQHFPIQAEVRRVNLFYLHDDLRERLVARDDGTFTTVSGSHTFGESQINELLLTHPERFSPNVLLRPLYQECILPNLAYVGGGGEMAYWIQLKGAFGAYHIPMPVFVLRNSALVLLPRSKALGKELQLLPEQAFADRRTLETLLLERLQLPHHNLERERTALQALYEEIASKMAGLSPNMERSARAAATRSMALLSALEQKMNRHERRKHADAIGKLERWYDALSPKGSLQERTHHFAAFYLAYGDGFIAQLIDLFEPFEGKFAIIAPDEQP
jgi:bacillithiol biosynthesis cysteine-adding enzyme BshC